MRAIVPILLVSFSLNLVRSSSGFECTEVIVHGEPRSGTTWVTQLVGRIAWSALCAKQADQCAELSNDVEPFVTLRYGPRPSGGLLEVHQEHSMLFPSKDMPPGDNGLSLDHLYAVDQRNLWHRLPRHNSTECFVAVLRDPRDVVVSEAHDMQMYRKRDPLHFSKDHGDVPLEALETRSYAIRYATTRCTWMGLRWLLWKGLAEDMPHRVRLMFYDDLVHDTLDGMQTLTDLIGVNISVSTAEQIVSETSFKRWKEEGFTMAAEKGNTPNARRGQVGSFREELGQELAEQITAECANHLPRELQQHWNFATSLKATVGGSDASEAAASEAADLAERGPSAEELESLAGQWLQLQAFVDAELRRDFPQGFPRGEAAATAFDAAREAFDLPLELFESVECGALAEPDCWLQLNFRRRIWPKVLARLPERPNYHGKGIVMVASAKRLPMVLAHVERLRSFGCALPVELWHLDEIEDWQCRPGEALGLSCRNLNTWRALGLSGYQLIAPALLTSRFLEVIYIGSDVVFLKDPTFLFEYKAYSEQGLLLWSDLWHSNQTLNSIEAYHFAGSTRAKNAIWTVLNVEFDKNNPLHASSVNSHAVFNKQTRWEELCLLVYFSIDTENNFFHFRGHQLGLMYGDQASWKFASLALGHSFHLVESQLVIGATSLSTSRSFEPCMQAFGDLLDPSVPLMVEFSLKEDFLHTIHCCAKRAQVHFFRGTDTCQASTWRVDPAPMWCLHATPPQLHGLSQLPSRMVSAAVETSSAPLEELFRERAGEFLASKAEVFAPDSIDCTSALFDPVWKQFRELLWMEKESGLEAQDLVSLARALLEGISDRSMNSSRLLLSHFERLPADKGFPSTADGICRFGEIEAAYLLYRLGNVDERRPEFVLRTILTNVEDLSLNIAVKGFWPHSLLEIVETVLGMPSVTKQVLPHAFNLYIQILDAIRASGQRLQQAHRRRPVTPQAVAVISADVGLSLQLQTSLADIFSADADVIYRFFGQHSPQDGLAALSKYGKTDMDGRLAKIYERWADLAVEDNEEWLLQASSLTLAVAEAFRIILGLIPRGALLVCTKPMLFCLTLQQLLPADQQLLLYFFDAVDVLPPSMELAYWSSLKQVQQSRKVAMLSSSVLVSALIEYGVGLQSKVAHPLCLYATLPNHVPLLYNQSLSFKSMLILKSTLLESPSSPAFGFIGLLRAFLLSSSLAVPITEWPEQEMSQRFDNFERLQKQVSSKPAVVLYMPDKLVDLLFYEMYSMGMPMLCPGRYFLSMLAIGFPFEQRRRFHDKSVDGHTGTNQSVRFLYPPWTPDAAGTSFRQRRLLLESISADALSSCPFCSAFYSSFYWVSLSDLMMWPYIMRFDSVASLLMQLDAANMFEVSAKMIEFHYEQTVHTHNAFVESMQSMIG